MDANARPVTDERRDADDALARPPLRAISYHNNRTQVAIDYRGFNGGFKR